MGDKPEYGDLKITGIARRGNMFRVGGSRLAIAMVGSVKAGGFMAGLLKVYCSWIRPGKMEIRKVYQWSGELRASNFIAIEDAKNLELDHQSE